MKTVNIKGKEYVEVNQRIIHFRNNYKGWSLESEIVSIEDGVCIIKAYVKNTEGRIISTGLAYEKEGSTFINKTSYIENCETSAWGRALGNLGIGIDMSIASYEEVGNAVKQQKSPNDFMPKDNKKELELNQLKKSVLNFCMSKGVMDKDTIKKLAEMTLKELNIKWEDVEKNRTKFNNKLLENINQEKDTLI